MSTQTRTLLLSQGYDPIKVISWQRAITLRRYAIARKSRVRIPYGERATSIA